MGWKLGLEGRGVVVTGGAGGIGGAVARAFDEAGARVAVVDLDQAACEKVVEGFEEPERHLAIGADLCDLDAHSSLLERVESTFGRFDVLTHLAAALRRKNSIFEVTEEDWDLQIDTNLKATFFLNRAAAQRFREQGRGGRIINFTSQAWWSGSFGGAAVYAASKGGVVSVSRSLARELAADGITVNTIAPGGVETPMMSNEPPPRSFLSTIPIGRMAEPEEMSGAVLFLASPHADYITGATINATGGQLMY